jgi:hypothetical protein
MPCIYASCPRLQVVPPYFKGKKILYRGKKTYQIKLNLRRIEEYILIKLLNAQKHFKSYSINEQNGARIYFVSRISDRFNIFLILKFFKPCGGHPSRI